MKKSILFIAIATLSAWQGMAQDKKKTDNRPVDKAAPAVMSATPATTVAKPASQATDAAAQNPDLHIKFNETNHNFGNVPEGPSVSCEFEFENIGKVPVILSNAVGSCGCTVPTWPKEPILPGKKNKISVTYNTQGRPGQINKTITVTTNVGTKVLSISGNVEKIATGDAPPNVNH